jgi:hypothetical protein
MFGSNSEKMLRLVLEGFEPRQLDLDRVTSGGSADSTNSPLMSGQPEMSEAGITPPGV